MLPILALIVLPYIVFVFFGESFNPFHRPRIHAQRGPWKYGRAMGLAAFLGTLCAVILINVDGQPLSMAAFYGASVTTVLAALFSARKLSELFRR